MDFVNLVIVMAVLSGPLWLIALAVPVSLFVAYLVAKGRRTTASKIGSFAAVLLAFFLVLFGDEIAGRMFLNHLCATEAGVKVYQTVELPAEYWDEGGNPRFLTNRGILRSEVIGDRFVWDGINEPYVRLLIKIDKKRWVLHDKSSKRNLAEKTSFVRHYGWLNKFSPASTVGESCRDIWSKEYGQDALFKKENSVERDLSLRVFTKSRSSN